MVNVTRTCCDSIEHTPHRFSCPVVAALHDEDSGIGITLNADDPIENALIEVVRMNRRKRADYAVDGDPFSNFRAAAHGAGVSVEQGIEYMIATKQARLVALRSNGRAPQNESVYDTVVDRAVYGIIALAYALENKVNGMSEVSNRTPQ